MFSMAILNHTTWPGKNRTIILDAVLKTLALNNYRDNDQSIIFPEDFTRNWEVPEAIFIGFNDSHMPREGEFHRCIPCATLGKIIWFRFSKC